MTKNAMNEINYCSSCGHPNNAKGKYCSSCGVDLNLDPLEIDNEMVGINFFAIFVGWLVAEIAGYVSSSLILNQGVTLFDLSSMEMILLVGNPLALLAGGFTAANIARVNHRIHGVLVTFLTVILTLLFSKLQNAFFPPVGELFTSYSLSLLAAIIGASMAIPAKKN